MSQRNQKKKKKDTELAPKTMLSCYIVALEIRLSERTNEGKRLALGAF